MILMIQNNIINNIDVDKLPEDVQDAIIDEFSSRSIKDCLMIYSRLVHGFLFKVSCNDLFNITKNMPSKSYNDFVGCLKERLIDDGK